VIYLSGYAPEGEKHTGPVYGPILQKPLRMRELVDEVTRQLA
jgi:hypothetical protein